MEIWLIWLIVAAVLVVIEVLTQMMWALCLSVGALAAMICALFGLGFTWQAVALAAGAVGFYLIMLPWFRKRWDKKSAHTARTGMDALLGRTATVTSEIRPGELGRARIDGDNWQVKAPGVNEPIHRGEEVVVSSYDSIILTVERK